MKKLMIKAHRLARKIVEKYGDVDYQVQFSLCLQMVIEEHQKAVERILSNVKSPKMGAYVYGITKKQANYVYACCKNYDFKLDKEILNFMYDFVVDFKSQSNAAVDIIWIFKEGMELIFNGLMSESVKYFKKAYWLYTINYR